MSRCSRRAARRTPPGRTGCTRRCARRSSSAVVDRLWAHQATGASLAHARRPARGGRDRHRVGQVARPTSCRPCRRASRSAGRAASAGRPRSTSPRPRRSPRTSSPSLLALGLGVRATTHDGDSSHEQRDWARDHGEYLLTNPDMLHRSLLPGHARWARFLGSLRYVVVDECHHYRGVFGAHVAHVLRRLRRVCALYGADPTFVLASATVAEPDVLAGRLTGLEVAAVTDDASPRGEVVLGLWEPPFTGALGENGAPVRRAASSEVGRPAGRPGRRGRPHAGVRPVAAGRRGGGATASALLAEVAPELAGPGGAVPRRLPARGAPRAGGRRCAPGGWSGWPRPTRSSSASTSAGSTPC